MKVNRTCTHTDGPQHSCAYVDAINKLIPDAAKFADSRVVDYVDEFGAISEKEASVLWDMFFHEEMDAAAESAGLRIGLPRDWN